MATNNFPVPAPMEMKGDLAQNWSFFRSQYENYEIATGLDKKGQGVRMATLLSVMGRECFRIYQHVDIAEGDREDITKIIDALEKHFEPTRNVIYERYKFNTCIQDQSESIDQYITKLKQMAATCKFGQLENELIRDRLVLGAKDTSARARMLREPSLNLQKAIDMCRNSEIANAQWKSMNSEHDSVNYTRREKNFSGSKKKGELSMKRERSIDKDKEVCKYCGGKHRRDKKQCPAYGVTCNNCSKKHHFAKVCKNRDYKQSGTKDVKIIMDDISEQSSEESLYQVEQTVGTVRTEGEKWYATLSLSEGRAPPQLVQCQMDCGSTCNIISYKDYCKIVQDGDPSLYKSDAKLRLYDGTVMIPLGTCELMCDRPEKNYKLNFQVLDTQQKPLLSAATCEQLGLLTVNHQRINAVETQKNPVVTKVVPSRLTQEFIENRYADVFTGLGALPGEYHMEIDTSIKPVQAQPRRVAVALKPELKKEIEALEKKQVIAKVTTPSDWISSMVAVRKPTGKLRICIDPKDLNRALKRSHYQIPTIDEILPRLGNAKVFTVLDAKEGFWQVVLDEESSYLTTFWTPFGRYRWLRMPFGINTAPEEFQRRLHEVMEGLSGVEVIADDILVYGSGDTMEQATEDHDQNLVNVLERARQLGLKLNKQKLKLRRTEVAYMGHLLTSQGLQPDPKKIQAVVDMPIPNGVPAVQGYWDLSIIWQNFYLVYQK